MTWERVRKCVHTNWLFLSRNDAMENFIVQGYFSIELMEMEMFVLIVLFYLELMQWKNLLFRVK